MRVPFFDLKAQYALIKNDIDSAVEKVLSGGQFVKGVDVDEFENAFARVLNCRNCIAVDNGTDALFAAVKALDIGAGDEVITPAWSWISTSEIISLAGARPVFADVDEKFYTIDPAPVSKLVTKKTKAVIVVHLYGQSADLSAVSEICKQHNLFLIEDCAQAHLTSFKDKAVGTWGAMGTFSFYPTKNLGALGDAGAVVTNNDEFALKVRRFANHGGLTKDEHVFEGMNSRMDTMQAAILNAKMKYLQSWNEKRRENAVLYSKFLKGIDSITLPQIRDDSSHTFHLYVIRSQRRDELKSYLLEQGIETMIHYPRALPLDDAYKYMNHERGDFPVAAKLQEEVLSLPIYPELSQDQIAYVCDRIKDFYG